MQAKNNILRVSALQDYYGNLTKGEKSKFLRYLIRELEMSSSTMIRKLRGNYNGPFRLTEITALEEAVRTEVWREE